MTAGFPRLAIGVVVLGLLAACAPAGPAATQPAGAKPAAAKPAEKPAAAVDARAIEEFYKGKTLTIVVGTTPGGGFDVYARMIARHMSKHIPGSPTIIVENRPGAGQLIAANTVYHTGRKDGTMMVHFIGSQIIQQLIGNPAVEFDARQYIWLGAPTRDNMICYATRASGFTSLAEARGSRQLVMGGLGPGNSIDETIKLLKTAGDLNIKLVSGYGGTPDILVALDKDEVMGTCWGREGLREQVDQRTTSGELREIGQGGMKPLPDLPNLLLLRDLAKDDDWRKLIDVGTTFAMEVIRGFALPPGVPPERVQALRSAFMATLTDPALLAEAERAKLPIDPISGEAYEQVVKDVFALSPDLVAKFKSASTSE
jgi:tripartite-type tricarboxylate transporter receptor subunit TctC